MNSSKNDLKTLKCFLTKKYSKYKNTLKSIFKEAEKLKIYILKNQFTYLIYKKEIIRNCNMVIDKSEESINLIKEELKKIKILKASVCAVNQLWSYCYKNKTGRIQEIIDILTAKLKEAKKFKYLNEQYNKQNGNELMENIFDN